MGSHKREIERICGRNPVYEVLRAGRRHVRRLFVAEGVHVRGVLAQTLALAEDRDVAVERVPRRELDRMHEGNQGIVAEVGPYPYSELEDILDAAGRSGETPLILLLDVIQNPQNLGTLLRTAEAVGVHGVVIPYRRGVGVTHGVVSASAGASEHMLIARENLAQAIQKLKQAGVWVVGLEYSPEARPLEEADMKRPLALVVGSEGQGMRRLVRESCDFLVRLPMRGRIESLNAAVAGSIALYAAWEARAFGGALAPPEEAG